ncbi:MAG TPA: serine/threonine-protein kinase [Kofleriaceae bacterium]|nr:serine/threonine-protein kinase [Kofleriaceae bacterium]
MPDRLDRIGDEDLQPDEVLGRYRIVRRIALGGMAELYLAYAHGVEGFEKIVAIKRVQPSLAMDPEFVTMFLDEARLASTLSHPNIAQVYDVGQDGHSYFIAMEYVDGRDARHLLREAIRHGERMPIAIAVGIAGSVAAALHAAHENRAPDRTPLHIVHRDVSPGNVLVTFGGAVKLIDFGIAKAARRRTVTQAGQLKGKAGYMSPEQCNGGRVDRRSDIFSLGVVLYELTTTTRLFRGPDDYNTMRKIVSGQIKPPSTIVADYPPELEAIVMRALARDPDERYQTARDMHLDLIRFARAHELEISEYDLAKYVQRLMPEEEAESILQVALDDIADADEPEIEVERPLRALSHAETFIATRDDAHATSIYVANVARVEHVEHVPVLPRIATPVLAIATSPAVASSADIATARVRSPMRWWHVPALVALAAITFAGGWLVAATIGG